MKVVVYENWYNDKHRIIARAFAEGVPGAVLRDVREYEPADVAVIFGGVKKAYTPTHAKQEILDRHKGRSLIIIESAFVKRGQYWQIGFGGTAGKADFRNENMPFDRWLSFGISGNPWQKRSSGPLVVCGQLLRDTQVQDTDHAKWCRDTFAFFKKKRVHVIFRPHPKAGPDDDYGVSDWYCDRRTLAETLNIARGFVTWNSTSAVDAIIAGVPVMVCDDSSIAWPMGVHGVQQPRELIYPERKAWLAGLGYAQWSIDEMKAGLPWKHLTRP